MAKTSVTGVSFEDTLRKIILKLAKKEARSFNNMVRVLILEALLRRGCKVKSIK